jgi:hypothetical protein
LVAVYEAALREVDLTGHADPRAATLAKAIIRFWRQGERDPRRLYERAIEPLSGLPPAASADNGAQTGALAKASWRGLNRGATIGSSPGPTFAMTGCIGFQSAQLTGENKPGLGGMRSRS